MLASAVDMVVTFAGEVLFERKTPTLTKLEATLGDRFTCACQVNQKNLNY